MWEQVGKYKIKRELGRGGMAIVYEAVDTRTGEHIALKVLYPYLASQPALVERFLREAQVATKLHSPYIAKVLDFGQADVDGETIYYIAMEYIPGTTLNQLLQKETVLSVNQVLNIAYQVARALAEANQHGIVHRDIKPENIMMTPDGTVRVMDFGIARDTQMSSLTVIGTFMGTLQYSSPEQAAGKPVDIRSDIYSLGVVLYQLLTGATPFQAGSTRALFERIIRGNPVPVEAHRVDLPPEVSAIVNKMLQRKPENRFQSPDELAKALRPLLGIYPDEDLHNAATVVYEPVPSVPLVRHHEMLQEVAKFLIAVIDKINSNVIEPMIKATKADISRMPLAGFGASADFLIAVERDGSAHLFWYKEDGSSGLWKISRMGEVLWRKEPIHIGSTLKVMAWDSSSVVSYNAGSGKLFLQKIDIRNMTIEKVDLSEAIRGGYPSFAAVFPEDTVWVGLQYKGLVPVIGKNPGNRVTLLTDLTVKSAAFVMEGRHGPTFRAFILAEKRGLDAVYTMTGEWQKVQRGMSDIQMAWKLYRTSGSLGWKQVGGIESRFAEIKVQRGTTPRHSRLYLLSQERDNIEAFIYDHRTGTVDRKWSKEVEGRIISFGVGGDRLFSVMEDIGGEQCFLVAYDLASLWRKCNWLPC